jgi:predicted phosphodiesterase
VRLAIISDIHGNLEALTTALQLIKKHAADETICLGDVVGYGANPNECLTIVRERCSVILLGNHDAAVIDLAVADQFTINARLSAIWTNRVLLKKNKEFLETLPLTKSRNEILLAHGSPFEPEEWHYIISEYEAMEAFQAFPEQLCFVGHSHIPVIFSEKGTTALVAPGDRFIINVGSIGQPRDGNPQLSFGIFDTGTWMYKNIRADYDIPAAAQKIKKAGLPRALADRLMFGV